MNVELRRRKTEWAPAAAPAANDNPARKAAPTGPRAVIYRPAKSAMTSGRAGTRRWVLEFEPRSPPFVEPLMGWTGSTDPLSQVRLSFPSCEAAMRFTERQGLAFEVHAPAEVVRRQPEAPKPEPPLLAALPLALEAGGLMLPQAVSEPVVAGLAA